MYWIDSPTLYIGRVQFQFLVRPAMRFTYSLRKMAKLFANNEDPDQTPRLAVSDLSLHCYQLPFYGSPDYNELSARWILFLSAFFLLHDHSKTVSSLQFFFVCKSWCLFCHYMFITHSFGASRRLWIVMVVFHRILHFFTFLSFYQLFY